MKSKRLTRSFRRQFLRLALLGVRAPWLTLIVSALVLALSIFAAEHKLKVSTDQNKLFSSDVGFFHDYLDFVDKFPENEAIYVIVEARNPKGAPPVDRWTALADRIAARLRSMPDDVKSVDERVPLDKLGKQGILFERPAALRAELEESKQFSLLALFWAKPNLFTARLGNSPIEKFLSGITLAPPNPRVTPFVGLLADGWVKAIDKPEQTIRLGNQVPDLEALDETDPQRRGYYYVPDETDPSRNLLLIKVFHRENFSRLTAVADTVDAIRSAVNSAATEFPEFVVGLTGRPVLDADEMRVTDADSRRSEIIALTAVFIGLVVMLRSIWMALAAELALAVGIGWTFGWATISRGELNLLSTVFLIALIGIGMDYLVQLLTRYRREAARHGGAVVVWAAVFRHVGPPINTACLGAAGAFFVSLLTEFQGAADLGVIAGGGLILCLLAGYTVLPALLTIFPVRHRPVDAQRYRDEPARRAKWLVSPAIWATLLAAGVPFMLRAHFDPNLLNLQAQNLQSVQLVKKLQTWSAVVLSKDLGMLEQVRKTVEQSPEVSGTESVLDANDNYATLTDSPLAMAKIDWGEPATIPPAALPTISQKARALAASLERQTPQTKATTNIATQPTTVNALRNFADRLDAAMPEERVAIAAALSAWQKVFVTELDSLLSHFHPGPLAMDKVPEELRGHFVADDGSYALYIEPRKDLWKQENLERFVRDIDTRVAAVPGSPHVTGIASDIYHTTSSIRRAFYTSAGYALGLIFVLVLIDLRRIGLTFLAVSVLGLGLPMLVALMGLFDVSWNFANFFALPILIGAGHEYGVFMVHRYVEARGDARRAWRGWDTSDRALLLCAYVTSTSFGFFWAMGHHRGLQSLGLVMALGTACIYCSAVFVLRPLLRWKLERES